MNSLLSLPNQFGRSVARIYSYAVLDTLRIVKTRGFRELLRQRGWRFLAGVIAYYVVRDTFLYVLLPFAVARGFF